MASEQQISSKDAPTNPRGIPHAPFIDKVEDYVSNRSAVEGSIEILPRDDIVRNIKNADTQQLLTLYSKYQFMQSNTEKRVVGLKDKIPDIQKTLDTVQFLQKRTVDMSQQSSVINDSPLIGIPA